VFVFKQSHILPSIWIGAKAIADAIRNNNGALSALDVSNNAIPPAEKALLQSACDGTGAALVL
jgi:hypothetical protein